MAGLKMNPWVQRVCELNIEHYRRLLAKEPPGARRTTIQKLLAAEEVKLSTVRDGLASTRPMRPAAPDPKDASGSV